MSLLPLSPSRQQVIDEHKALGNALDIPDHPWGIISIKAQVAGELGSWGARELGS